MGFMESFHEFEIAHRNHEPAEGRNADSLVRESLELGSRGHGCPRFGRRFMESGLFLGAWFFCAAWGLDLGTWFPLLARLTHLPIWVEMRRSKPSKLYEAI
jgi:hypothetical protein